MRILNNNNVPNVQISLNEIIHIVALYGNFRLWEILQLQAVNRSFREAFSQPILWRLISCEYNYSPDNVDNKDIKYRVLNTKFLRSRADKLNVDLNKYLNDHRYKNRCDEFFAHPIKQAAKIFWVPLALSACVDAVGASVACCSSPGVCGATCCAPTTYLKTLYPGLFCGPQNLYPLPCTAATGVAHTIIWAVPIAALALVVFVGCGVEKLIQRRHGQILESSPEVRNLRGQIQTLNNLNNAHGLFRVAQVPEQIEMLDDQKVQLPGRINMCDTELTPLLPK